MCSSDIANTTKASATVAGECTCKAGYFSGIECRSPLCKKCDDSCVTCNGGKDTNCTTCDPKKFLEHDKLTGKCSCKTDFVVDTANPGACKPKEVVGCVANQYKDGADKCIDCPAGCEGCTFKDTAIPKVQCLKCVSAAFKLDKVCKCIYQPNSTDGTCVPCTSKSC
jgi:hypothetical protein